MFNLFLNLTSLLFYGTSDFRKEISLEELEAIQLPTSTLPASHGSWNAVIHEPISVLHETQCQASLQEQHPSYSNYYLPGNNRWTLYTCTLDLPESLKRPWYFKQQCLPDPLCISCSWAPKDSCLKKMTPSYLANSKCIKTNGIVRSQTWWYKTQCSWGQTLFSVVVLPKNFKAVNCNNSLFIYIFSWFWFCSYFYKHRRFIGIQSWLDDGSWHITKH